MSPFIHEERGVGWSKVPVALLPAVLLRVPGRAAGDADHVGTVHACRCRVPAALSVRIHGRRHAARPRRAGHLRHRLDRDAVEPRRQLLLHLCRRVHRFCRARRASARWLAAMLAGIVLQGWLFRWPLYVSMPTFIVAGVIGATQHQRRRAPAARAASCAWPVKRSSRWQGSPSASGSVATSTICSATRCRSSS